MGGFEDHFSEQAREYASHRPHYPGELFVYLASISPGHNLAWDCGTGNGQAALELARHYKRVVATDASADQIGQAVPHEKIDYRVERVEEVSLEPRSADLVTVATAVHWFDLDAFYQVVRRVSRQDGILAVWMYHLPVIDPSIDPIVEYYYQDVLAGYWPERFHYLAERYQTLPFPFEELKPPEFTMRADWELGRLIGFLDSWSATRRYKKERGENPIANIWEDLFKKWGEYGQQRTIRWPLYLRVGRVS